MGEQCRSVACILCRYNLRRAQDIDRPRGNVAKIADWRRHDKQGATSTCTGIFIHMRTPVFLPRLMAIFLIVSAAGHAAGNADVSADAVTRASTLLQDLPSNANAQQQRLLMAAMLFASGQAYAKASETLNRIDTTKLDRELRGDFLVTAVDVALAGGKPDEAFVIVSRPPAGRYAFIDALSALDRARVAERRARVLERRGQFADAIRERVLADASLPADAQRANNDALWAALLRVDRAGLKQLQQQLEPVLSGWASLAAAWREGADSATLRSNAIEAWVASHPAHPAASALPAAVAEVRTHKPEIPVGPSSIAVILPQHGKLAAAGTAIQRGLLAAWFQARENNLPAPTLTFLDSSRSDFLETYDAAIAGGAQLIIGPLEKENLRLLQSRAQLPVATLALNYADSDAPDVSGLFQFGLAGEDEAAQAARFARRSSMPRVAVLYPDAEWGQRITREFENVLTQEGGQITARAAYGNPSGFSEVVKRLLDASASEQRHARLEKLLGSSLVFEARRRQDIDALFLVANTQQAVLLTPAIRFHYGNDLPTLATSHINSQSHANASGDLDNIRFLEMPWLINTDSPLRLAVTQTWQGIDDRLFRLYGLGVDAFRISERLPVLAGTSIEGATGALSLGADGRISRESTWMTFREQRSVPVDDER